MKTFFIEIINALTSGLGALSVLEITVGHRKTLSDQILKMSGQFRIMIGHDDRTSHQHILSYLQGVVICKMYDEKGDLKGHMSCE